MEAIRYVAVGLTFVELCVLCVYYFPLVAQVPWFDLEHEDIRRFDDNYVSYLLSNNFVYRILVTVFVIFHLLLCVVFVAELNFKRNYFGVLLVELIFLVLACVGWFVLISFYVDEAGHLTPGHIIGTVLFISASGVYFLLMIINMIYVYRFRKLGEYISMLLSVIAFLVSVVAGIVFVVSFVGKTIPFGWMFEHAAFIFLVGAHILLFMIDVLGENDMEENGAGSKSPESTVHVTSVRINTRDVPVADISEPRRD
jgi:hypothetical protein